MIVILLENGFELCEALITYDLLKRANIDVRLVRLNSIDSCVKSSQGATLKCDLVYKSSNELINNNNIDMVVLPGGMPGKDNLQSNLEVINLIKWAYKNNKYLAAICASPSIFINLGYLKDFEFNCYPGFECNLNAKDEKVVIKDKIITSKALGTAFDFGFKLIEILKGLDIANSIKSQIFLN